MTTIMVKRIHPSLFLIGIIVGSMLMYAVRETRTTDSALSTGSTGSFVDDAGNSLEAASILTVFSDLTGIHRELYLGYKYVEINGLVEPAQIIIVPFYIRFIIHFIFRFRFRKKIFIIIMENICFTP